MTGHRLGKSENKATPRRIIWLQELQDGRLVHALSPKLHDGLAQFDMLPLSILSIFNYVAPQHPGFDVRHPTPGDPRNSGGAPHHQQFHTSMMIIGYLRRQKGFREVPTWRVPTDCRNSFLGKKKLHDVLNLLSELSMQPGSEKQGHEEWPG